MNKFRFKIVGRFFDKDEWIQFYEDNQVFITLCSECQIVYNNQKQPVKLTQKSKVFLLDWFLKAKALNLSNEIKRKEFQEIQQYRETQKN